MLNAVPSLREESRNRAVLRNPKYVAAAALVAATTFALYRFLATPGGLHDGDLSFPITAAAHLREHYPIWSLMGFGNEPVAARLFFHIPFVLIAELLSLDGGAYAKLIITSSVVGAGLAAYAAARIVAQLYMPRRCAAYPWSTAAGAALCGFFYALNPWSLAQLEHFHIVAGLAPAPLIFALLLRGLMLGHHRSVVLAALAAALVGSITPHTAIVTLSLVVAVTVFHVAVGFYPAALAARLRVAMTAAALFASVYIPTAAFGWLPVLLNVLAEGPPIPIYIIVDQDLRLLASNQTWLNTVRLVGNWYWSQTLRPAEGASAEWNVISLIPLATLVAGSVAIRTLWRPIVFLLAIGSVAAVLVSAFASPPFDEALRGAVSGLPFGWLIREPDRGSWFLVLAYSLGTGLISIYLLSAVAKHYGGGIGLNRWMTTWMLMFAVIASILVGYTVPAIRGVLWDRNTALQPQVEPRVYLAAESSLKAVPPNDAGRILIIAENQQRFWSRGRRVDSFLARSLDQRSVSNITELGRTFSSQITEIILAGGNPQKLLLDAGITLVAVEAGHPVGQTLRIRLSDLSYPTFVDGDFLTVFQVPAGVDASEPAMPSPPLEVWGGIRIVAGMPSLEPGASAFPAVSADYTTLAPSTVGVLQQMRIGLSGPGTRELSVSSAPGVRLIPVIGATLNSDPTLGWARGRATDLTYSQWRSMLSAFGVKNWQLDHGLGLLFTLKSDSIRSPLPQDLAPGRYRIWIRAFSSPSGGDLKVAVLSGSNGGGSGRLRQKAPAFCYRCPYGIEYPNIFAALDTVAVTSSFDWWEIGDIAISEADSPEVILDAADGLNAVSAIAIAPSPSETPVFGFGREKPFKAPPLAWTRASPSKYVVRLSEATEPSFLVLHEHFNRKWIARVNGLRIEPLLTAGISNGYPIPAVGDAIVTIEYGGQIAYDAGIAISGITGLAAVGYVVVERPDALARGVLTAARLIATRSAVWLGKSPYRQAQDIWLLIAISPAAARNALAMSLSMAISQIQAARSRIARWASGQWNRGGRFVGRLSSRSRALTRATSAAIWSVCVRTSIAALNSFWIKSPPGVGRVYAAIIRVSVAIGRLAILLAVVLLPTAASFAISGSPELANTLVTVALASVVGAIVMFVMGRYDDQARDATTDNPD